MAFILCSVIYIACPLNHAAKFHRGCEVLSAKLFRPTHTPVFMNDGKVIGITSSDEGNNHKIISTTGLIGCVSAIVYTKKSLVWQHVLLTHYARDINSSQIMFEKNVRQLILANQGRYEHIQAIIITPSWTPFGYCESNAIHNEECQTIHDNFVAIIRKNLCDKAAHISVQHLKYDIPPPGKPYFAATVKVTLSAQSWCEFYSCGSGIKKIILE